MIRKFKQWLMERRSCYIVADPRDNSVSFSKKLFKELDIMGKDVAKVFVFLIPETGHYGFTLNPDIKEETQLADVMYNSKYKTIGFECLCPTVNRIFYDYGLPSGSKCKLSVRKKESVGLTYYQICKPLEE